MSIIDDLTEATERLIEAAIELRMTPEAGDGQARLKRDMAQRHLNGIIERAGNIEKQLIKAIARESLKEKQAMFEKEANKSDHDLCFTTNFDGEYTFKDTSNMFDAFLWGLAKGGFEP